MFIDALVFCFTAVAAASVIDSSLADQGRDWIKSFIEDQREFGIHRRFAVIFDTLLGKGIFRIFRVLLFGLLSLSVVDFYLIITSPYPTDFIFKNPSYSIFFLLKWQIVMLLFLNFPVDFVNIYKTRFLIFLFSDFERPILSFFVFLLDIIIVIASWVFVWYLTLKFVNPEQFEESELSYFKLFGEVLTQFVFYEVALFPAPNVINGELFIAALLLSSLIVPFFLLLFVALNFSALFFSRIIGDTLWIDTKKSPYLTIAIYLSGVVICASAVFDLVS